MANYSTPSAVPGPWVDRTASRALATNYTNTGSLPRNVAVQLGTQNGSSCQGLVAGVTIPDEQINTTIAATTLYLTVPAGAVYRVNGALTSITKWFEQDYA